MYRAPKVANRICYEAEKDRLYQIHLAALQRIRASSSHRNTRNTRSRSVSNTSQGPRDYRQNFCDIMTSQGTRSGSSHVTKNHRCLKLIQSRQQTSDPDECVLAMLDHQYQVAKGSQFARTVPMTTIVRRQLHLPSTASSKSRRETSETTTARDQESEAPSTKTGRTTEEEQNRDFNGYLKQNATAATDAEQTTETEEPKENVEVTEEQPAEEKPKRKHHRSKSKQQQQPSEEEQQPQESAGFNDIISKNASALV